LGKLKQLYGADALPATQLTALKHDRELKSIDTIRLSTEAMPYPLCWLSDTNMTGNNTI